MVHEILICWNIKCAVYCFVLNVMSCPTSWGKKSSSRAPAWCSGGMGLIPQDSDYFFVPCLCLVDQFTLYSSHNVKIISSSHLEMFDSSLIQCLCHMTFSCTSPTKKKCIKWFISCLSKVQNMMKNYFCSLLKEETSC